MYSCVYLTMNRTHTRQIATIRIIEIQAMVPICIDPQSPIPRINAGGFLRFSLSSARMGSRVILDCLLRSIASSISYYDTFVFPLSKNGQTFGDFHANTNKHICLFQINTHFISKYTSTTAQRNESYANKHMYLMSLRENKSQLARLQ